jgi:conjugal transfer mating pair stabilization protein TraN
MKKMRELLCLLVLLTGPFPLHGKDAISSHKTKDLMQQTKEEAQDFASLQEDAMRGGMKKGDPQKGTFNFSREDFLSEEEKGKTFDLKMATEESDLKLFVDSASKRERLEGTEEFLADSRHIIDYPQPETGITSVKTRTNATEERFETCLESGTYQLFLIQKRVVEVTPEVAQETRHCRGHEEHEKLHLESNAKDYRRKKEKKLAEDTSISSYKVKITEGGIAHRYVVVSTWTHKDQIACKNSIVERKIVQEASEKDRWETDNPEALSSLSSNPHCRMLYSKVKVGPETRSIGGSQVFRDSWEMQLFFSCGDDSHSKCAKLREKGATIYKKKCLKSVPFNEHECDLWEKVYKVSNGKVFQDSEVSFSEEEIWGLSDNFDASYEANADFGPAVTTLDILSDIKQDAEKTHSDFSGEKCEVFKGLVRECQRSFIEGSIYDCCSKMDGVAVASKLCRCTSEEKDLAKKREEGKCHYVGTYEKNFGTEKVQAFCCFPTKLARVIHEEGRKQLGLKWGSAEKPKCSGLTVNQLKSLDFSRIDLSEVVEDLKIDKQFVQRKIQDVTRDLQSEESKLRMRQQSEKAVQIEKEKRGLHG